MAEATSIIALNGIEFGGFALACARPREYTPVPDSLLPALRKLGLIGNTLAAPDGIDIFAKAEAEGGGAVPAATASLLPPAEKAALTFTGGVPPPPPQLSAGGSSEASVLVTAPSLGASTTEAAGQEAAACDGAVAGDTALATDGLAPLDLRAPTVTLSLCNLLTPLDLEVRASP